jgi:hypothetical protein
VARKSGDPSSRCTTRPAAPRGLFGTAAAAAGLRPRDGGRRQSGGGQNGANLPVNIGFRGERRPGRVSLGASTTASKCLSWYAISLTRLAARPLARLAVAWCKKDTGEGEKPVGRTGAGLPARLVEPGPCRHEKAPKPGPFGQANQRAQLPPMIGVVQLNLKFTLARTTCDLSSNVAVEAGSGPIAGCVSVVLPKSMYRYSTPSDH